MALVIINLCATGIEQRGNGLEVKQLAEAHAALANVAFSYDWDFETAEREFRRALALNPNNPTTTLWYSHLCIARNRLPQALEENSRL